MMKRNYKKPTLYYECIELMDAIAACSSIANASDEYNCTYTEEGLVEFGVILFVTDNPGCLTKTTVYNAEQDLQSTLFGS